MSVAVSEVIDQLTCPICLGLFQDPVELQPCGHLLCQVCAVQVVAHSSTAKCPSDRVAVTGTRPCNLAIRNVVEVLKTAQSTEAAANVASQAEAAKLVQTTEQLAEARSQLDRHQRLSKSASAEAKQIRAELNRERTARATEQTAANQAAQEHQSALQRTQRELENARSELTSAKAEHRSLKKANATLRSECTGAERALADARHVAAVKEGNVEGVVGNVDNMQQNILSLLTVLFEVNARRVMQDPRADMSIFHGTVFREFVNPSDVAWHMHEDKLRAHIHETCGRWFKERTLATVGKAQVLLRIATKVFANDASLLYSYARAAALLLDSVLALTCLSQAIAAGYNDRNALAADADFSHVRGMPHFATVVAGIGATVPTAATTAAQRKPKPKQPQTQTEMLQEAFPSVSEDEACALLLAHNRNLQRAMCASAHELRQARRD